MSLQFPPRDDSDRVSAGLRVTVDALAIDIIGDDPTALVWLAEFLGPAFVSQPLDSPPAGAVAAQHSVQFEVAPAEHAGLHQALAGAPLEGVKVFTFDGSFSRHRGWDADDKRRWIHDTKEDTFYGIDPSGRSIRLVATGAGGFPRVSLMRVVRELATTALLHSGKLPVHGAAFVHDEISVLVCGPRRSGKTTLLLHALRCGAPFISNDRLFVTTESPIVAQAVPTIVMLRDGSLAFFEEMQRTMDEARFDRAYTVAECAMRIKRASPHRRPGSRRGISPAQLCELAGGSMFPSARVGTLLFPRIDPETDGIVLEPLAAESAATLMNRSLLKASHPTSYSAFFAPGLIGERVAVEVELHRCRRLAEQVPAYVCSLGPNAFQTNIGTALHQCDHASPRRRI